ncbi:MAG: GNAT family N-acetyltransferase, partial [Planctomycetales bacterium]|nr:GNAT family N-acetyltransferase [Planctomycetales bacterium]
PAGLLVAVVEDQPIGFAHAGFGPAADLSRLDHGQGVISMLAVPARPDRQSVAAQLLQDSEKYLRDRGAEKIYALDNGQISPFYVGLYGGSDP